ncbi:MAG: Ig-like domain-containing protein [Saprospiraceae bacterium]
MNYFTNRRIRLLIPLLFLGILVARGQSFEPMTRLTYLQGQTVHYAYNSIGNPPSNIYSQTNHSANYNVYRINAFTYNLVSSSLNAVGKDTVVVLYRKPPQGQATYKIFEITVLPSYLKANDDFITTDVNTAITIPVTANDTSNRGVKVLTDIAVNYNGTVSKNGNDIIFVPEAGFEGLASLNYVVCDDLGTCDAGTAHICVGDPYGYDNDTLQISTIKNKAVPILTPLSNYTLISSPDNGTVVTQNGISYFEPDNGFTGLDEIVYEHNTQNITKTLLIDVLNHGGPNTYLTDDVVFTSINNDVEIDLLENDLGGTALYNVDIVSQPENGTLTFVSEGYYVYTPNPGFEGVDEFTYEAAPNSNGSGAETAKASVIISNLNPSAPIFDLRTPKATPLVINYNIPLSNYDFTITSQGTKGNTVFYPGNASVNINGRTVNGYNLLVYYPTGNNSGLDEVELEYCIAGSSVCPTVKLRIDIQNISTPPGGFCVDTDCVWAGDANKDGKVDLRDLLPIGLCMGDVGLPRPNALINPWFGQDAANWGSKVPNSIIDLKHLDTDGDSIITAMDTVAISEHYQATHSMSAEPVNFPTNIPLYLGQPDTTYVAGPGDMVSIPIILGNEVFPAFDIYGLTFTIDFNTNIIDADQSFISFDRNSWMSYSSPVLNMVKKPFGGRFESGYTRTNGNPSSGYGVIGTVNFIIIDDLDPQRTPESGALVSITASNGMNQNGYSFGFQNGSTRIEMNAGKKAADKNISTDQMLVYPNPTDNLLNIHLNGGYTVEQVEMVDMSGRLVYSAATPANNRYQFNTNQLEDGIYILRAITNGCVVSQKVSILRN